MFLRSLRQHVALCSTLSQEVRDRQAAQRQQAASSSSSQAPAPIAPPVPKAAAAPVVVPPEVAAKARKSRLRDDWDPVEIRAAYKKRFPHRQMSLTDLPAPQKPDHLDTFTCLYCSEVFATPGKCSHHSRACVQMPYGEWLRRVRICHHDYQQSSHNCPHCGTGFATPKAAGRHGVACRQR